MRSCKKNSSLLLAYQQTLEEEQNAPLGCFSLNLKWHNLKQRMVEGCFSDWKSVISAMVYVDKVGQRARFYVFWPWIYLLKDGTSLNRQVRHAVSLWTVWYSRAAHFHFWRTRRCLCTVLRIAINSWMAPLCFLRESTCSTVTQNTKRTQKNRSRSRPLDSSSLPDYSAWSWLICPRPKLLFRPSSP